MTFYSSRFISTFNHELTFHVLLFCRICSWKQPKFNGSFQPMIFTWAKVLIRIYTWYVRIMWYAMILNHCNHDHRNHVLPNITNHQLEIIIIITIVSAIIISHQSAIIISHQSAFIIIITTINHPSVIIIIVIIIITITFDQQSALSSSPSSSIIHQHSSS